MSYYGNTVVCKKGYMVRTSLSYLRLIHVESKMQKNYVENWSSNLEFFVQKGWTIEGALSSNAKHLTNYLKINDCDKNDVIPL